jgi:hypothetical protein
METIPGGAFLAPDGKTWLNSEGKPLSKEQIAQAKALDAERAEQLQQAEEERITRQVQNDPLAQVMARVLGPKEERRVEKGGGQESPGGDRGFYNSPVLAPELADKVGVDLAGQLAGAGFDSPDAVHAATDEELLAVEGIGRATLRRIREALKR